jgi:L-2-hydroxyglutarate oxidase LhgO
MDYDVLILGGGIVGCAAAYELSKYSLNIALIEKDHDIADDVALANSAVIYDGSETSDTLMSKLERMGSELMPEITSKFNVPYKKCGYLLAAEDEEGERSIEKLFSQGTAAGYKSIQLLDGDEIRKLEPGINLNARKALYSKNFAVTLPYDLAISYGEVAFDNGVNFKLDEEVLDIKKINKGYRVITNKNRFTCHIVVNTTPNEDYSIDISEKLHKERGIMDYFIMTGNVKSKVNSIVTTLNKTGKNIAIVPNIQDSAIVTVDSDSNPDYSESLKEMSRLLGDVSDEDVKSYRKADLYRDSMIIDDSLIHQGYIKVVGKHYGLVAMTPAIATIVVETIRDNNKNCVLKKNFFDKRRDFIRFKDMTIDELNEIIKINKDYGRIVCSCGHVSEGEIVDAIRRPLGARTLEGIKRRTGAMAGVCSGQYCLLEIARILSRETGKSMLDIVKDSKNSRIVVSRIKEFDEM